MHIPANTSRGRSGELFSAVVDDLLDAGLNVRFRAGGNSMRPAVDDGEYLIVAPINAREVAVGDVVLCQMRRGPIAHRVCAIERPDSSPQFTLCGDASLETDVPVAAHQLRGQVVGVERDGTRRSLEIAGGMVGRAVFMMALRLRRALRVARGRVGTPALPVPAFR